MLAAPAEAPSAVVAPAAPQAEVVAPPAPPVPLTLPVFNADYLDNPAPLYPPASRRLGEQGRGVLRVLVNVRGTAEDVQVRTTSGFARLDDAARDTVRGWKFVPARRGAEPVPAWVLIPFSFRLEG
jgi:protein TonB